jgi:hypothetical protein
MGVFYFKEEFLMADAAALVLVQGCADPAFCFFFLNESQRGQNFDKPVWSNGTIVVNIVCF